MPNEMIFRLAGSINCNFRINFRHKRMHIMMKICILPFVKTRMLMADYSCFEALFKYHCIAVLMAQFATTGIGYTISCICNPRHSQMAAVVIVLISTLLSGMSLFILSISSLNSFCKILCTIDSLMVNHKNVTNPLSESN